MFGKRADGRKIKSLPGFFKIIPYIMPKRNDAVNLIELNIDCRPVSQFIRAKANEGYDISFMSVIIAAFIRAIADDPEMNRFIANKKIYARNYLSVCFVVLKKDLQGNGTETVAKIYFKPTDTIFDVAAKVNEQITGNRVETTKNGVDKIVDSLFVVPFLVPMLVGFLKLLDRWGILPKAIIDASPFHTSLFISNMASIKMNYVYHHIYNFGTTSVFCSMGSKYKTESIRADGSTMIKQFLPLGVSTDERICSGSAFAKNFHNIQKYINDPSLLEVGPEQVHTDLR